MAGGVGALADAGALATLRCRACFALAVLTAEAPVALADAEHALASSVAILGARGDPTLLASPPLVAVALAELRHPHAVAALVLLDAARLTTPAGLAVTGSTIAQAPTRARA